MSRDGIVVGIIHPAPSPDEKPVFEIIRDESWKKPPEDVRPCDHKRFILDEKWRTVTCGVCREHVDAFAALIHYARNYHEIERRIQEMKAREKGAYREELKRLSKLQAATDEDRAEIAALLRDEHRKTENEYREAAHRLGRKIQDQKWVKRQARRGGPQEGREHGDAR